MTDGRRLEIPKVSVLEDNTSWREQIATLKTELGRVKGELADLRIDKTNHELSWKGHYDTAQEEAEKREAGLREVLEKIAKGEGRYSRDHFQHCKNTVEDMKALAAAALKELGLAPKEE